MIAAGLGCRRGTPVEELEAALKQAQEKFGIADADIAVFATVDTKADEPGIAQLAELRGIPVQLYAKERLDEVTGLLSPSARVRDLFGVASVAEASALAATGRNARLLGPRVATAMVTCALAAGDGVEEGP